MKKLFSLFALTSLLFASSCSEDAIMEPANGDEATVTFSAELPNSINSRAYSDGNTATHLDYAIYVSGQTNHVKKGVATFSGLKATFTETLATGVSYDIIFWATDGKKAESGAYTVDWTAKTMTVDYSKLKANDESNDAFYHFEKALKVEGAVNKPIQLYRPFAQVNLGTDDFATAAKAGLTVESSSMVMTDVPNILNFEDGTVEGNAEVTLAKNAFATNETFPVTGYSYLEMNYVLAGAQKSASHTCTFSIYKKDATVALNPAIVVSNVPVQRNFRTNIYGSLLTDPATFNVEIKPAYETPDYNYNTDPKPVGKNTYEVNSADGLMKMAGIIADTPHGEGNLLTFKLTADIDMQGLEWTPLAGMWINLDGQGYTISNLSCGMDANARSAFFGYLGGGIIQNITFENVTAAGEQAGIIAGNGDKVSIENVTIKGENSVSYKDTEYNETWGGVGAVFGVNTSGERSVGVTIQDEATIYVNKTGLTTEAPEGNKYSMLAGVTVTDNGSVKLVETIADGLLYNAEAKTYEVSSANGLMEMAYSMNNMSRAGVAFKGGENLILTADIDLAGEEFPGLKAFYPEKPNTFDGQGFTVSNVTNTSGSADMGFIKSWVGPIKNVTIKDAKFQTGGRSAILAANVYGDIDNCHVEGGSIKDSYWTCGAIAGMYNGGNISNCTVKFAVITSNGGLGGIVGVVNETAGERKITDCTVTGCSIVSSKAYGDIYADAAIAGMFNVDNSTLVITNCNAYNCNIDNMYGWASESSVVIVDGVEQ